MTHTRAGSKPRADTVAHSATRAWQTKKTAVGLKWGLFECQRSIRQRAHSMAHSMPGETIWGFNAPIEASLAQSLRPILVVE